MGIPWGCWWVTQCSSGPLISLLCEYGDPCLFLSMPCAFGCLMGHFKPQVMCFRATSHYRIGATPCQRTATVFLLPCPSYRSYSQSVRTTPSLPVFPALVASLCAYLTRSSMTLIWQQPPQRKQPPHPLLPFLCCLRWVFVCRELASTLHTALD